MEAMPFHKKLFQVPNRSSDSSSAKPETRPGIEKAATLLLVRDAPAESMAGIEVFMLERPSRGAFPGLHVFTGGKVDPTDNALL